MNMTHENPNPNPSSQEPKGVRPGAPYSPYRPQAERPEPGRRMGTLTFGVCLVAAGVLLLIWVLAPDQSLSLLAQACRLSPLVLVGLGAEILVTYFRHQGKGLRYDGWGIFLTLLLVLGASSISGGVALYDRFGPANRRLTDQVQEQINADLYQALSPEGSILSCETDLMLHSPGPKATEFDYRDMTVSDYLFLHLTLDNTAQTREAFAAACRPILEKVTALGIPSMRVYLENDAFSLELNDPFAQTLSVEGLTQLVEDNSLADSYPEVSEEVAESAEMVPGESQAS